MPYFAEKPASSGQVHEFLLPDGLDGLHACEEQSGIPEKWRTPHQLHLKLKGRDF